MAESSARPVDALLDLIRGQLLDVNTSIPAQIVSYADGLAQVQPTGKKRFADGDALDYPVISGVRVCWPAFAGGKAGIKGPVRAGDKCLLVFSQQAVDGTEDRRMFDLQDAFAVMCDLGAAVEADSPNNADMTMYFGEAFIRLTEDGKLMINAPGGTTITTPNTLNTGTFTTDGHITYNDGLTGKGESAHSDGSFKSNGVPLHTHKHTGVQAGPSQSGPPGA